MDNWLKEILCESKESLIDAGIPPKTLSHIRIKLDWKISDARAYTMGGSTIYVSGFLTPITIVGDAVRLLRHEIGHVLVSRYYAISKEFCLPEYHEFPSWYRWKMRITEGYGSINPEEQFCEDLADMKPATVKRLKRVLKRARRR